MIKIKANTHLYYQLPGMLSGESPVAMVGNEGTWFSGKTLSQAFHRLEMAELTARSLLASTSPGQWHPLSQSQLDSLKTSGDAI